MLLLKGITSFTRNICTYCRLAADIVPGRLESAKLVGADVTINCKEENLKDRGIYSCNNDDIIMHIEIVILIEFFQCYF